MSEFQPCRSTKLSRTVNLSIISNSLLFIIIITSFCCTQAQQDTNVPTFTNHNEDLLRFEMLPPASHRAHAQDIEPMHFNEMANNNKSIYSSLTKIIYQLKNQLERQQQLSKRQDKESNNRRPSTQQPMVQASSSLNNHTRVVTTAPTTTVETPTRIESDGANNSGLVQNVTTITVNAAADQFTKLDDVDDDDGRQPADRIDKQDVEQPVATNQQLTPAREKRIPSGEESLQDRNRKRLRAGSTRQPRRSTVTTRSQRQPQQHRSAQSHTLAPKLAWRVSTARSSKHDSADDDGGEPDENFSNAALNDSPSQPDWGLPNRPGSIMPQTGGGIRYRTFENVWSTPVQSTSSLASGAGGTSSELDFEPKFKRYGQKALQLAEASPMKVGEFFGASNEISDQVQMHSHHSQPAADEEEDELIPKSNQGARWPRLNPQEIHLERVYPHSSINSLLANQKQASPPPPPPPIMTAELDRPHSRTGQLLSPPQTSAMSASLYTRDLNNQPTSSSYATQHQQHHHHQQQPVNTNHQPQRDLMNQPQTIQITAVPNNGGLVNGVLGGGGLNQLLRVNTGLNPLGGGQFNGLWNSGLWNTDAWGRPVMMVNAERRQVDWSFWIWPIILVATLPIVLGALFVPVFLKTVVILIQILQSLGLLLPLASALSQQVSHATGAATSVGALTTTNQLEHVQKEAPLT